VFWISASDVISVIDVSGCSVAEMHTSIDASSLLTAFAVNYTTKYNYPGAWFSRSYLWPPYRIGQAILFLLCGFFFFFLSIFFCLFFLT